MISQSTGLTRPSCGVALNPGRGDRQLNLYSLRHQFARSYPLNGGLVNGGGEFSLLRILGQSSLDTVNRDVSLAETS